MPSPQASATNNFEIRRVAALFHRDTLHRATPLSRFPPVTSLSSAAEPAVPSQLTLVPFRLRKHADYQRVYAASRKYHSASMAYFFRLRTVEEATLCGPGPRVGLTVPRALGKAVTRNRIKRRMREAIRLHLDLLRASRTPAIDLILHPRPVVAEMEFTTLEREIARLLAHVAAVAPHPQPPAAPRPPRAAKKSR